MPNLLKFGSFAAFTNAIIAITTLLVAIFLIGLSALTDPNKFADLAINNPTPLIIQDLLKFVSAAISCVLILALYQHLHSATPKLILFASVFGFLSVFCLLTNAVLSIYTISHIREPYLLSNQLQTIIGFLALIVILFDGLWCLLLSYSALKSNRLPKLFSYLGICLGILSLVPQLGILVLILSVVWSLWLGQLLLKSKHSLK